MINDKMLISTEGLDLIMAFEGVRLTAYRDVGGVWTIGYGATKDVRQGQTITQDDAVARLARDAHQAADMVRRKVRVPLTQAQFDALASLVYNIGGGAFARSTLLKKLNSRTADAAQELLRWDKVNGKAVRGLARRRRAEYDLFTSNEFLTGGRKPLEDTDDD